MRLKFLGQPAPANSLSYTGFDPVMKEPISVLKGEIVEVSEEKAQQLLADFPKAWKKASAKNVKEAQAAKPEDPTEASGEKESDSSLLWAQNDKTTR